MNFTLKNKKPTVVGWYWLDTGKKYDTLEIVKVRNYSDGLAIGNNRIDTDTFYDNCLWSEPIPLPENYTIKGDEF